MFNQNMRILLSGFSFQSGSKHQEVAKYWLHNFGNWPINIGWAEAETVGEKVVSILKRFPIYVHCSLIYNVGTIHSNGALTTRMIIPQRYGLCKYRPERTSKFLQVLTSTAKIPLKLLFEYLPKLKSPLSSP